MRRRLFLLLPALALLAAGCRTATVVRPEPTPIPETIPEPIVEPAVVPVDSAPREELPLPPPVAREFRGAWVTPLWGGEWPSRPGLTPAAQRDELIRLLDRARSTGLNAVVLHVRAAADALYPTTRAPWSIYLTGVAGRAPDPWYDPLAFAIEEAHRRGLELHAWFNPFRASPPDRRVVTPPDHVAARHPERVVTYAGQLWLDPGVPAARQQVLEDILEVVDRYDVDGIHLDDYFYPYIEQRDVRTRVTRNGRTRTVTRRENIPFPDDASWRRYGQPAGYSNRGDWRRAGINEFVARLYREVKARKPWVAVGISPFGIWRPGSPAGITGLDAYSEIYADARQWLREGWLDYVAPQLYWPLNGSQQRFTRLDGWWREQNVLHRHVWPGLHTELEATTRNPWARGEISRQVDTLRAARAGTPEAPGHIHFRLRSLFASTAQIGRTLHEDGYADLALAPSYPWLDATSPAPPLVQSVPFAAGGESVLEVQPGDSIPVRWWLLQWLDGSGLWHVAVHPGKEHSLVVAAAAHAQVAAVSSVSRTGIESPPTVVRLHALADAPLR